MLDAVAERFRLGDKKLYFDMLGSDHIPFNFFVPLRAHESVGSLVREWSGVDVGAVTAIDIEWAPTPSERFLGDNTSFDACIRYRCLKGGVGAIGVEVKFTEGAYSWGGTERARMFERGSRYLRAHEASGLYVADSLEHLRTRRLKQLWRNQLLGEAMLQQGELSHFTSVLLYPEGNRHFAEAAAAYEGLLAMDGRHTPFRAVTFERFIARCREHARSEDDRVWADYLAERYLVG